MTNQEIDIFIISYNRLTYLAKLVAWLERAGFEKIHIVDNASTYPPLVDYLEKSSHSVHRLEKNFGHLAVWECGRFDAILKNQFYMVSDCDVLPAEECPMKVTEHFWSVLKKYPQITKVGFGLRIDDLPESYALRENVVDWEKNFWQKELEKGLFEASIDTTFALYRPGIYPQDQDWWKSIRTGLPFVARHLPWYENSAHPSEEDIYYQKSIGKKESFWGITDLGLLRQRNKDLRRTAERLKKTWRWPIGRGIYGFLNFIFPGGRFARKFDLRMEAVEKREDPALWQKENNDLTKKLGAVYSSFVWRIFEKFKKFEK